MGFGRSSVGVGEAFGGGGRALRVREEPQDRVLPQQLMGVCVVALAQSQFL